MDSRIRHAAAGTPGVFGEPSAESSPRRRRVLEIALRIALVLVVAAGVLQLLAAASYQVSTGSVTFRLRPAWPGGHLIMPLGPAGELSLRTHRTPVDVIMDYQLPAQTAALFGQSSQELPRLEGGAREAFDHFLRGRIPWLLLTGAAAGVLVAGLRTRKRLIWGLVAGAAAALLFGGGLVLVSYATLDRSPSVQYEGLATRVPSILPLLQALSGGGDQSDRLSRLHDFLTGLEAVATQLTNEPRSTDRADVVRLLLASDIHDNVFGAGAASRLAAGDGVPVDAVLFAGDLTDQGTAEEAKLFLRVYGELRSPVLFVGGNHEDAPAMRVFRAAGFQELYDTTATVSGVTVLGASDPVASSPQIASDVPALTEGSARLATLWAAQEPPPRVLLVHDEREAADTVAAAKDGGQQLLVAYGNDHVAAVTSEDGVVLVDAGTAGASGYEAIGAAASPSPAASLEPPATTRDVYTFQLIDFSRADPSLLVAVTTVSYVPGGRTVVTYTPFGP